MMKLEQWWFKGSIDNITYLPHTLVQVDRKQIAIDYLGERGIQEEREGGEHLHIKCVK